MTKKIKILHMFRELEIGGIQSFVGNIYNNMDRNLFQFDFLVSSQGVLDEEYLKKGSKIHYIPYVTQVGPFKYKRNLINFFNEHKEYDILHIHFDKFSGLIAETAKECGVKTIICHSHTISNETSLIGKIYKNYLQCKIVPNATNLFACSEKAAKYLFKKDYKKVEIIYNGIDLEKFKYNCEKRKIIRKKYNIKDSDIVIGCVGRLSKEKNHKFLLKVLKELVKKDNNYRLLLVGDGEEREKLIKLANKLEISDKVIFALSQKNTVDFYSAMDMFVLPSLHEGLGIVLIEAQANGLPCIASTMIPKEADASDEVLFISLNKKIDFWVTEIIEKNKKRKDYTNHLIKKGYDIKFVSKKLEQVYINVKRKNI